MPIKKALFIAIIVILAGFLSIWLLAENIWLAEENNIIEDKGTIRGTVLIGPTCPVVKNPPDPNCADKPYKTTVQVIKIGSPKSSPFAIAETDDQGRYTVTLPPGEYALQPIGGSPLPRCETKDVTVELNVTKEVNLSCDTGIR